MESIIKWSDVTSFRRENADDFLRPYVRSGNVDNLKFAKSCYEGFLGKLQQGYHVPGLFPEDCERQITSLGKRIEEKLG